VELRGFEPLTSAMRTNAAPFTRPTPNQQGPTSAQVASDALWHQVGSRELPQDPGAGNLLAAQAPLARSSTALYVKGARPVRDPIRSPARHHAAQLKRGIA
jgi:hypothetical protein